MKLTHLDENGAAHMVNIGAKPVTQREAVAQSRADHAAGDAAHDP